MDPVAQKSVEAEVDSAMGEDTPTTPIEQPNTAEDRPQQQSTEEFRVKVENVPGFIGTAQMKKFLQT